MRIVRSYVYSIQLCYFDMYHIGDVMVSVLALVAVDRLRQTKDYNIGICCFFGKHAA